MSKRQLALGLVLALAVAAAGGYAAFVTLVEPEVVVETDANHAFAVADGAIYFTRSDAGGRLELLRRSLDGGAEQHLAFGGRGEAWTVTAGSGWVLWSWPENVAITSRSETHAIEVASGKEVQLGSSRTVMRAAFGPEHLYFVDTGLLTRVALGAPVSRTPLEPAVAVAADDDHVYALRVDELVRWPHGEDHSELVASGFTCGTEVALGRSHAYVTCNCLGGMDAVVEVDLQAKSWRHATDAAEPRHPVMVGSALVLSERQERGRVFALVRWSPADGSREVIDERASVGPFATDGTFVYAPFQSDRIVRFYVRP